MHIEHHIQDAALVVSGVTHVSGDYAALRPALSAELEALAARIDALGGIVGHIKAAAAVTRTEMFSVTESTAAAKEAPAQEIEIKAAAIVFGVTPEDVEPLLEAALHRLRGE